MFELVGLKDASKFLIEEQLKWKISDLIWYH